MSPTLWFVVPRDADCAATQARTDLRRDTGEIAGRLVEVGRSGSGWPLACPASANPIMSISAPLVATYLNDARALKQGHWASFGR